MTILDDFFTTLKRFPNYEPEFRGGRLVSVASPIKVIGNAPNPNFVNGLDTLRFFAAVMVAASHLTSNLPMNPENVWLKRLFIELGLVANGGAAVGLFFVISGFCIHLRQARTFALNAPTFLARRIVRIGLPLISVLLVSRALGPWATAALKMVLWSIYCELAYYVTYPLLLACRRRCSMGFLLTVGILAAILLVFISPTAEYIWGYGAATAVICYPLWLAGALLAERHNRPKRSSKKPILAWRLGALLLCSLLAIFRQQWIGPASGVTLVAAGLFSMRYLPIELGRWDDRPSKPLTEKLGRASYSLYLVHILPVIYFNQFSPNVPFWAALIMVTASIVVATWIAYYLCERPALRIAKSIGSGSRVSRASSCDLSDSINHLSMN